MKLIIMCIDPELLTGISTTVLALITFPIAWYAYGAYREGKRSFKRERFENRFFEMIKIYRDNVSEMKYTDPDKTSETFIQGRDVFVKINREFLHLYKELLGLFKDEYSKNKEFEKDLISITWLTIFFGLGGRAGMLEIELKKYHYDNQYKKITDYIPKVMSLLLAEYSQSKKKYGGHQIRLGHYNRHFFQSVTYVHKQNFLTLDEKREFVKMLRAQMSTHEQVILFYNVLSPLGEKWEYSKRNTDYSPKGNIKYKDEDLLITNYKLIKNIPMHFTGDIIPKRYFEKLIFEYEENVST